MAVNQRSNKTLWIILAVIGIIVLLFAGLLPLPGQKDNVTPLSQPSPPAPPPQVEAPTGPPASPPSQAGAGTQPPPGGEAPVAPGSATGATSSHTMTEAGPK